MSVIGFFFSSRRRHTRSKRDWSSDVCSSDLSTGYGKSFVKLDNGVLREGAYRDIGALLDWIRTRADLDADHVLVTGGSYGGHMTLVSATLYNDRICCSVDVVGISSLATFLKNTSGYRQDLRRVEYGDERDSTLRAWMERTAPLN